MKLIAIHIITFFFSVFACGQPIEGKLLVKDNCREIEIKECYYKDVTMLGSVKLFTPFECDKAERINKLILQETSWILIDMDIDDIKLYLSEHNLTDVFTLDSVNYQNVVDENHGVFPTRIETEVFFISKDLMTYSVILYSMGDKGSPYYEYINIDIKNEEILDFNTLIDNSRKNSFEEFVTTYAIEHKEKIIDNYQGFNSEKADHLLYSYLNVFKQPYYDLKKVTLEDLNASNFSHFTVEGAVFNIKVKDENFLLDKERKRIEEYVSYITIPYEALRSYIN